MQRPVTNSLSSTHAVSVMSQNYSQTSLKMTIVTAKLCPSMTIRKVHTNIHRVEARQQTAKIWLHSLGCFWNTTVQAWNSARCRFRICRAKFRRLLFVSSTQVDNCSAAFPRDRQGAGEDWGRVARSRISAIFSSFIYLSNLWSQELDWATALLFFTRARLFKARFQD